MSEKKRGFFGRLFGGKDAPDEPETPAVDALEEASPAAETPDETPTPVEMEVAPVAALGSEPKCPVCTDWPGFVAADRSNRSACAA